MTKIHDDGSRADDIIFAMRQENRRLHREIERLRKLVRRLAYLPCPAAVSGIPCCPQLEFNDNVCGNEGTDDCPWVKAQEIKEGS